MFPTVSAISCRELRLFMGKGCRLARSAAMKRSFLVSLATSILLNMPAPMTRIFLHIEFDLQSR